MTTDQPPPAGAPAPRWGGLWLGPLGTCLVLGLLLLLPASLVTGAPGVVGVATGTAMVCAVFSLGAVVLGVVAWVAPAASLLVALLTYTLQVVLVGVVYVVLSREGALDGPVDPEWLSAAVIACTLAWTITQVVVSTRTRQPVYDGPAQGREASVR